MNIRLINFYLLFVLFASFGCQSANVHTIPVSDFFADPERTSFKMSPNGKYISYLLNKEEGNQLVLLDISTGEPIELSHNINVSRITTYQWSDSTEVVYVGRNSKQDSLQVFMLDVEKAEPNFLFSSNAKNIRFLTPVRKQNGAFLLTMNERDTNALDVYRLHSKQKKIELIAQNPGNVTRWITDLKGDLRLAQAGDSVQETILYRKREQDSFEAVAQNIFYDNIRPIGFVKDKPDHIFALSNIGRDKLNLVDLNLITGKEEILFSHATVDVSSGGYAAEVGEMAYAYWIHEHRERFFLDKRFEDSYKKLEKHLPGYEYRVIDENFSKQRVVVFAFKDTDPGVVCYFDGITDHLIKLYEINPKLKKESLAKMDAISYYSRDSLLIHGFLTLPTSGKTKNLPVIVFPHNGPSERNYWGYNPEVQFFANHGYAVLQVNFRGSTGYGKQFWKDGFQEWGRKIQNDITDGVNWLIDSKIADAKKIGIYGVGFGGYSALHAAAFQPELYACAASYGGFTNLFTHIREVPPMLKPYLQKYYTIIGNPETDSERLRAMSPVFYAEKVKKPVFIAQGGKDSRSSANEINQFVNKIRRNDVPITYIFRENEGQVFRKEENRFLLYEDLIKFFDVHLKSK